MLKKVGEIWIRLRQETSILLIEAKCLLVKAQQALGSLLLALVTGLEGRGRFIDKVNCCLGVCVCS